MRKTVAMLLSLMLLLCAMPALAAEQTFTFASNNDMMTLDVSLANDEMSGLVLYAVNEGLIRSEGGKIVPGIAESWDVSEDGLTYTFHLRDAKWSDGKSVTAGDFAYSFLRTMNPETASTQVEDFKSVKGAPAYYGGESDDPSTVGIVATDDKTLTVTLAYSDPFYLESLARSLSGYPIRQDYVDQYGAEYGSTPEKFIGCGPFTLTEWVQTASIDMQKNAEYWNADKIALDKVTELIVGDENTRAGMYDLGDVDALYSITKTQTATYPDYKSKEAGDTLQYLCFMTEEGNALANENLRKALAYAINREAIANAVCNPGTEVASRVIIPSYTFDNQSIADNYPVENTIPAQGDMEKAKAYLDAALQEMGLSEVSQLPKIRYVAMESSAHKAMAEAIQAQFQQNLGIAVDIDIRPVPQAIQALLTGDFDIFLVSSSVGVNPDGTLGNFIIGNDNNYPHWQNQAYTDLIKKATDEQDIDAMLKLLCEADQMLVDHVPVAPLWVPGGGYVAQDYVQGLSFGPWIGGIELQNVSIAEH